MGEVPEVDTQWFGRGGLLGSQGTTPWSTAGLYKQTSGLRLTEEGVLGVPVHAQYWSQAFVTMAKVQD